MTQMHIMWRDTDISAYVDGELEPTQQTAFETALAQDRVLQQKVKEMREVVALVRALPLREPPRNYLLTPSMVAEKSVAEKSPQQARRPTSLLFMRLATSLAAVAFVVTAGLTYMQRGISPTMVMDAPKAVREMPAMVEVSATEEVSKETRMMRAGEPEAMPETGVSVAEKRPVEKEAEVETVAEAPAPAMLSVTPETDAAPDVPANAPEWGEVTPQEEAWEAYDAVEPAQTPSWWLPGILGAATLLLAGITYWVSRRR